MHITRTINYGWNIHSVDYNLTCYRCNKVVQKSTSTGCNDIASREHIDGIYKSLEIKAKELSKQTDFICNKCLKDSVEISEDYKKMDFKELKFKADAVNKFVKEYDIFEGKFNKEYKGRIFKYNDSEWVFYSIIRDDFRQGLRIYASRISKVSPWKTTNHSDYDIDPKDIEISSQNLEDRKPK